MIQKYFSFSGRLNRKPYWMFLLVAFAAALLLGLVGGALSAMGFTAFLIVLMIIFYLAFWLASLSISIRRLHDRNKSAWWMLLFGLVPGILMGIASYISGPEPGLTGPGAILYLAGGAFSLWAVVELGFLKGTIGPNRFGPDPLADDQETVQGS